MSDATNFETDMNLFLIITDLDIALKENDLTQIKLLVEQLNQKNDLIVNDNAAYLENILEADLNINVNSLDGYEYALRTLNMLNNDFKEIFLFNLEMNKISREDSELINQWLKNNYLRFLSFSSTKSYRYLSTAKLLILLCKQVNNYDILKQIRKAVQVDQNG